MSMKLVVLDIESRQLVDDWNKPWEAGCSVACLWISWIGGPWGRFRFYREDRLANMLRWIEAADLLLSYNGKRYDCPAIEGLTGPLPDVPHCDLHELLHTACGHRVKLEAVARATLGRGKSGHGDGAPTLWAEGRLDELHGYCMDDVGLTRDLYLYAHEHGMLWVPESPGKNRRPVPIQVPGSDALYDGPQEASLTPATPKQIAYIQRLRAHAWEPTPGFSRSQASEMIRRLQGAARA